MVFYFLDKKYMEYIVYILAGLRPALGAFAEYGVQIFGVNLSPKALLSLLMIALFLTVVSRTMKVHISSVALLVLAFGIFSLLISPSIQYALEEYLRIVSYFVVASLITTVSTNDDKATYHKVIIVSSMLPIATAIYQLYTGNLVFFYTDWTKDIIADSAIYGTLSHPNAMAVYLVGVLGVLVSYSNDDNKINNYYLYIAAIVIVFIFLTKARVGVVGIISILIAWTYALNIKYRVIIVWTTIFFVLFAIIAIPTDYEFGDKGAASIYWRFMLWEELIEKNTSVGDWVFGHGLGYIEYYLNTSLHNVTEAHNDYLKLLIELGLFGSILYFYIIVKKMLVSLSRINKGDSCGINLAIFTLSFSMLIMSLTENVFKNVEFQWLYWGLVGYQVAARRLSIRKL